MTVGFYNFISADEVCLLLYLGLSSKRGGPVSFILIGKAVRLLRSINCITVSCNEFFSAFGAGSEASWLCFTQYQAL